MAKNTLPLQDKATTLLYSRMKCGQCRSEIRLYVLCSLILINTVYVIICKERVNYIQPVIAATSVFQAVCIGEHFQLTCFRRKRDNVLTLVSSPAFAKAFKLLLLILLIPSSTLIYVV